MSLYPFENPIGFGAADFFALALTLAVLAAVLGWNQRIRDLFARFAMRTGWCILLLAALPLVLRLILLPHHPVPTPDIYDEFGHLLVADTLLHFRLANPPHPFHRFFETLFVIQQPSYSSIYPIGQGAALAIGDLFGYPWAGVLLSTVAFSALSYWMLRAWVRPGWALVGGILTIITFGPLSSWMNSYWGGSLAAAAGCLVFGSLPRLRKFANWRDGALLGFGLGMVILIRPYESIFLFVAIFVYLLPILRNRALLPTLIVLALAFAVTLRQNQSVTGHWWMLPYQLSQFQYGVPVSLTIQADPVPHAELTPQQAMEYKAQLAFKTGPKETVQTFLLRLEYRVRYYRFFFLPPLYIALLFFFPALRDRRYLWVAGTILLYTLGTNLFPAFQLHYLAPIACLLILVAVKGLERLSDLPCGGLEAARILVFLCVLQFTFWYSLHLFDNRDFSNELRRYEAWDGINHSNPERRILVNQQLASIPGKLLIFVRYSPRHIFQDEWVYNHADIDASRIVWARDLGADEDQKLRAYYPDRAVFLLEPDFPGPRLAPY